MTQLRGLDSHDAMWTPANDDPVTQLAAVGARVCRCDMYAAWTFSNSAGGSTPAQNIASVAAWAAKMRSASPPIQPHLVMTQENVPWFPQLDTASCVAGMTALVKAIPGLHLEWGNEIEGGRVVNNVPEGPTQPNALAYVIQFADIVAAVKTADPTCEISPAPVANINPGGWGDQWMQLTLAAGLGAVPYDIHYVHAYSWPANVPPVSQNFYLDVATAKARWQGWGLKVDVGLSEFGWWSFTQNSPPSVWGTVYPEMTPALQAQYLTQFLQLPAIQALPVLILYSLADSGNEQFGLTVWNNWPTGALTPKPSFAAVQALWKPPPVTNYQSLYQAAIAQIQSVGVNQPTQWLAQNPGQPARTYLASLAGKNAAWLKGHPSS